MRYLLLSECLQEDFVSPVAAGEPLPNALHIGRAESRRLLGDPAEKWQTDGPLARFLRAWAAGAGPDHAAIHIRDWHDPDDAATRPHLEHFGRHCLRGRRGACFVEPLQALVEGDSAHHAVVDSAILSDFVGTDLEATLRRMVDGETHVRAGLIGVWTDFKVQYLAYELATRMGIGEVAVCSALSASRSRINHRQALEHMAASLDVAVIDSLPEFQAWLGIEAQTAPSIHGRTAPALVLPEGVSLNDEEQRLVEYLFRDCKEVRLKPLGGGFSGSRVFGTASLDRRGMREVPFVVKMDTHAKVARERVAVESVENLLGAASPRLAEYLDLETLGAIKYHFATMHAGEVRTLQKAFRGAPDAAAVGALFDNLIERVLSRLYQAPSLDRLQLFEYYGYRPAYAGHTLRLAGELAEREEGDSLRLPGVDGALPHPRRLYARLEQALAEEPVEVACCFVHGDLNLANTLLDGTGNVWLIDYFWTRVGHALQDIAKLENDLKFIMVPLRDDDALARAVVWEKALLSQEDLLSDPPTFSDAMASDADAAKAHAAVARLRHLAATLLREAGAVTKAPAREYWIAQLRYSAHTLSFDECDRRQKQFALASTCLLADALVRTR